MRQFTIAIAVVVVAIAVIVLVVFPTLQANVHESAANAAYARQQELLAKAEIERARAAIVSAKGEADALRMSINQPVAIAAIAVFVLAITFAFVLTSMHMREQKTGQETQPSSQPLKTIMVFVNGKAETLYIPEGADPALLVRQYLLAAENQQRNLVVVDRADEW